MKKTILLAASALALIAPQAMAQSAHLEASFGEISLSAGFTPDPYTVRLTAGGYESAAHLPGSCIGNISEAPDFEVTYSAGGLPLVFRTLSSADTTLVINGPDGRWYCDDDSYGDGDAQVRFNRPSSGTYDIWVGVLGDNTASASLIITETP